MKGVEKKGRSRQKRNEKTPPAQTVSSDDPTTEAMERKGSPRFRFVRLDGRDTLKYEDTADK